MDDINVLEGREMVHSSHAHLAGFGTKLQEEDKPDLLDSLVMED